MPKLKEEDLRLNLIINGDEARKKLGDINNQIAETKNTITQLEKERKKLVKTYGEESVQVKNLDEKLNAHKKGLANLRSAYQDMQRKMDLNKMSMKELSSHARNLSASLKNINPGTAEWKKYNNELLKTRQRMRELSEQSSATSKALRTMSATRGAIMGIVGAAYGLVRVFGGAIGIMKDFEQANAVLASILGLSTDEIADLTSEAERLGSTTAYTASEVTALQIELAKLGFNTSQIKAMEESVLNFATAVGATLPEAAALAGSTLRMFGLRASDSEDVLGALAVSCNKSALSFTYLADSMSTVGPVARTFGISMKDTTALLGTLANAGFDASSAATATRNILLNLADANGKLAKEIGKPVRTFPELISALQELDGKGLDLAKTLDLTDKRSVAAFNQFLRGADDANELRDALEDVGGELKRIAEERMDTLEGATLRLKSAWEGFILKLRSSTGVLKTITENLTLMIQGLTPGSRHNNSVDAVVEQVRSGEETVETIQEHLVWNQKKLDALQDKLDQERNKKEKKRLKEIIKNGEERNSVLRDALARLVLDDEAPNDAGLGDTSSTGGSGSGDDKKKKRAWSLNNDKAFLQAKAELMRQYNEGEIASQKAYDEQLYELEVSSYKARLAAHKDSGAARAKIEADLESAVMAHTKKIQDARTKAAELEKQALQTYISVTDDHEKKAQAQIQAEDERYREQLKQYEAQKAYITNYNGALETLERQHQNNLRKIRLEAYEAGQKDLEADHNRRLQEIEEAYADELNATATSSAARLRFQRQQARETAQENVSYLFRQINQLDAIVSSGEVNGAKLTEEQLKQYQVRMLNVRKLFREAAADLDKYTEKSSEQIMEAVFAGTGDGSLFGVSQSDWETLFLNIQEGTLGAQDLQTVLAGIGGAAQQGMKLASQAINTINAREKKEFEDWSKQNDEKKSKLEKRLDAGLMTQAQYNAEVERMEEEKQAREEEMALRQAERQKTMSIVQAIINTALGVTQTLAQWGVPAGIAPAAIMAALGAAEIAMIAAQPVGFAGGGEVSVQRSQDGRKFRAKVDPDKRGYVDRPTVLVGEEGGEYVIPAEGLENPSLRPFINTIENARRNGQLKSLNLEAVAPAMVVNAKARGGYTMDPESPAAVAVQPDQAHGGDGALVQSINRLNSILDGGIDAKVYMLGRNGIVEKTEEYARMKELGKLG